MKMKKWAIVLSIMLLGILRSMMVTFAADKVEEIQVGDNASAAIYSDGSMIITGSGAMWDFLSFGAATGGPEDWAERGTLLYSKEQVVGFVDSSGNKHIMKRSFISYPDGTVRTSDQNIKITSIVIDEGITYIGKNSFPGYEGSLDSIKVPSSVLEIDKYAFYDQMKEMLYVDGVNITVENLNPVGHSATITGYAGSAMEAYAKEHNITFVAIEEPAEQPTEPAAEAPEQPSEPETPVQDQPTDPSVPETPAEEQTTQPAIPETSAEESASLTQDLFIGTAGAEVTALQQQLTVLGYYDGIIDGDFGAYTEAAVIAFQKANGLYADGYVGPMTREKLAIDPVAASEASGSGQLEEPATPAQEPTTLAGDLYLGVNSAEVTALQQQLTALSYYDGIIDGDFGAYTEAAVIAFQKANGLYADGYVGPLTREKLAANPVAANAAPAQEPLVQPEVPDQRGDLSIGSVGDDVYVLQQQLAALGYLVGAVDGDFGSMTDAAVKAFQADNGLYVDGVVGPITKAALGL